MLYVTCYVYVYTSDSILLNTRCKNQSNNIPRLITITVGSNSRGESTVQEQEYCIKNKNANA